MVKMKATLSALAPACPQCGANKVVYSCEPRCCFNHVCSACRASFQLQTNLLGSKLAADLLPDELPEIDSCMPTTACANCESLKVYQMVSTDASDTQWVCSDCHSLLELVFAENEE